MPPASIEKKIRECAQTRNLMALSELLYYESFKYINYSNSSELSAYLYEYGAKCLAEEGYAKEAYEFLERLPPALADMRPALIKGMAEGFASTEHKAEAYTLLEMSQLAEVFTKEVCEGMMRGLVISNRRAEVYKLFEDIEKKCPNAFPYAMRGVVFTEMSTKGGMTSETGAFLVKKLKTIADQKISNKILEKLEPFFATSRSIRQTDKRTQGMVERGIGYNQIKWWINPAIQMLLLQGLGVNKINNESKERLPFDMVYHILAFLLPMEQKEIVDFTKKFYRQMSKLSKGRLFLSHCPDEIKAFFTPSLENAPKTRGAELEKQQSELPHKGVIDMLLDAPKPQTTESPASKKGFFKGIVDFTEKCYSQISKLGKGGFFLSHSQDESKASFTPSLKNAPKAMRGPEEKQSGLPHNGVIDILLDASKPQTTESPALQKAFFVEEQSALKEWKASSAGKKQQIPSQKTVTNTDHQVVVDVLLAASEPEKNEPVVFKRAK